MEYCYCVHILKTSTEIKHNDKCLTFKMDQVVESISPNFLKSRILSKFLSGLIENFIT